MMVYLTCRYRFSAAHRLHNDALTPEQNERIYGKCNNPYGHGHNYVLDVTLAGPVDPSTGMVLNLAVLDEIVQENILDRMDHTHLNLDVDTFRAVTPTTENICVEFFKLLSRELALRTSEVRLQKVRLEETTSNYFEYEPAGPGTLS
jgi:6-pyruvoyltetrahydropterin/6-carboxytetrahydropterin synthase